LTFAPLATLDTNILVSSMISRSGNEARVVRLVRDRLIVPAVSSSIFAEYQSVLMRSKFRIHPDVDELLFPFYVFGKHVEPQQRLSISTHQADNRLLDVPKPPTPTSSSPAISATFPSCMASPAS
jgi:putative PIN family toxin of toxin-antitoxin system